MKTETYRLPPDILAEFEAMAPSVCGREIIWTPEMDAVLLKFWGKVNRADFLAAFKARWGRGSYSAFNRRRDKIFQGGAK